ARRDKVAEQLELEGLERDPRLVAVGRDPAGAEDVVRGPATEQPREPYREVRDLRGVGDVAEVGNPGDAVFVVEEDVAEVEVAVTDLGAKQRPARGDALVEAVEDMLDEPSGRLGRDRVQMFAQSRRACDVPEQLPSPPRM